jgi:hypothetical protein
MGVENRKLTIVAAVLGVLLLLVVAYEFMPSSSTIASTTPAPGVTGPQASTGISPRPATRHASGSAAGKKERPPQSLDPTLHLQQLASTEQIQYEGSGRNIFISQPDPVIPDLKGKVATDKREKVDTLIKIPQQAPPPPIPLKFFGFASHPGEPKKIFLSKGDDVFIAGEGEIVDRRYKVLRISPTSVEMQDLVVSGPPQNIPLTQGNPS